MSPIMGGSEDRRANKNLFGNNTRRDSSFDYISENTEEKNNDFPRFSNPNFVERKKLILDQVKSEYDSQSQSDRSYKTMSSAIS
jgi:hypothetical protein